MPDNAIIPSSPVYVINPQAAAIANIQAAAAAFTIYQRCIDGATLRRQAGDLALFAQFLAAVGAIPPEAAIPFGTSLLGVASAWANVSHGLVAAFVEWQLTRGYAIGSINVRLATMRRYCRLAYRAGVLSQEDLALILTIRGYKGRQAHAIDDQRRGALTPTRLGSKKPDHHILSAAQLQRLTQQPDTPQGRRDALMLSLLADLGLRVSELAALQVGCIDLARGTLAFYREKVHMHQTHRLSPEALAAARAYLANDAPGEGQLLQGSRKNGELSGTMSTRAIRERIAVLGQRIGVPNLSPHDLRHTWATWAARSKSDPFALRDAGGWSSLAMPNRYVQASEVANSRIKLDVRVE